MRQSTADLITELIKTGKKSSRGIIPIPAIDEVTTDVRRILNAYNIVDEKTEIICATAHISGIISGSAHAVSINKGATH